MTQTNSAQLNNYTISYLVIGNTSLQSFAIFQYVSGLNSRYWYWPEKARYGLQTNIWMAANSFMNLPDPYSNLWRLGFGYSHLLRLGKWQPRGGPFWSEYQNSELPRCVAIFHESVKTHSFHLTFPQKSLLPTQLHLYFICILALVLVLMMFFCWFVVF